MKKHLMPSILFLLATVLFSCQSGGDTSSFSAGDLKIEVGADGQLASLTDAKSGIEYLHSDSLSTLIRLRFENEIITPESYVYKQDEGMLYFVFPGNREVKVKVIKHDTYVKFELFNIRSESKPDLLIWGPIYTNIDKTIGETVGVVRNDDFAIGIQSLNPKTLGGYPWLENDVMPEMDYFNQEDYSDLKKGGIAHTLYRIEAARPVKGGSVLHAYCRNRYEDREVGNWGYDNYQVKAYDDGGLIGSSIALFGCKPDDVLSTIAEIEIAEELPHPEINGVWSKVAPGASAAYMIMDFSEADFDKALAYTEQAGLKYLYHSGPFETWGHFILNKDFFPKGRQGLKNCVDKAAGKDISIGLHTLSNFITTNDAYVTPIPDKRLAEAGFSLLDQPVGQADQEIIVKNPSSFNQFKNNYLKAVRIDDEIIRYAAVSETEPWMLLDCQRGAFGTSPAKHVMGDSIFKLADHAYKVFLSNPDLTVEIARNIAALFNETEVRQISFDGLEGCRSTGMGNYGEILFTSTWYNNIDDNIKSHYIADASRTSHYFWHIFTRMNWGEPWYAGFRESQTQYRLKNQKYFDRNYIPNMLGWFLMKPETSIEDIEWLLARSAAFDAGYAFVTSYQTLENNGFTDEILASIAMWENTRMKGLFSDEQKLLMEDVKNEFELRDMGDSSLLLSRIYPYRLKHKNMQRQPGESVHTRLAFNNPAQEQIVKIIISANKTTVINPQLEFDGHHMITIPVKLDAGMHLKFDGEHAQVYSPHWQLMKSILIDKEQLNLSPGDHSVEVSCSFKGLEGEMGVELRIKGSEYRITNNE